MATSKKVLIVEDDQLIQRMYQKIFTFQHYTVVVANDGEEGVAKAQSEKPDVILMDVMMPKMNGMEALEKIKADAALKDIPVIMLSNLAGDGDMSTAMSKGALKYIIKSEHDPKEIVSIVDETIGEK